MQKKGHTDIACVENMKCGEVESLEKEWEKFRDIVIECTNNVCGMRCVGWQRRNWSDWWNEEVGSTVAEKRRDLRNGYREEISYL